MVLLVAGWSEARDTESYWKRVPRAELDGTFSTYTLDRAKLEKRLALLGDESRDPTPVVIDVPLPAMKMGRFAVLPRDMFSQAAAKKLGGVRAYRGQSIDDPELTLFMTYGPSGMRGRVRGRGTYFKIRPLVGPNTKDAEYHFSTLDGSGAVEARCLHKTTTDIARPELTRHGGRRRVLRVAILCTSEFSETVTSGAYKYSSGEAAACDIIGQVSEIFTAEFGVEFFVEELVVFTDANDPFTSNDDAFIKKTAQAYFEKHVGLNRFDVGHVFTALATGGNACIGSAGQDAHKGKAYSGMADPKEDRYSLHVAHEIGHQFGGLHTFNAPLPGREPKHAYEPGAGKTIMASAGLDGGSGHPTDYFHWTNVSQIVRHLREYFPLPKGQGGNRAPRVKAGPVRHIPVGTPFLLAPVFAYDEDGQRVDCCWEQADSAGIPLGIQDPDNGDCPLFGSERVQSCVRRVPRRGKSSGDEKLTKFARTMHVRVTARDNQGGTAMDEQIIHVKEGTAFEVTAPARGTSHSATLRVEWNFGATRAAPISVTHVDLLVGRSKTAVFDQALATGVANEGVHECSLEGVDTGMAYVMVRSVGNIFFALSEKFWIVGEDGYAVIARQDVVDDLKAKPADAFRALLKDVFRSFGVQRCIVVDSPQAIQISREIKTMGLHVTNVPDNKTAADAVRNLAKRERVLVLTKPGPHAEGANKNFLEPDGVGAKGRIETFIVRRDERTQYALQFKDGQLDFDPVAEDD